MRTNRTERLPRLVCVGTAIAMLPAVYYAVGLLLQAAVSRMFNRLTLSPLLVLLLSPVHLTLMVVMLGLPLVASCLVSRAIYLGMRWRTVRSEFGFCSRCGYDLTGNVSGVCPECGTGTQ